MKSHPLPRQVLPPRPEAASEGSPRPRKSSVGPLSRLRARKHVPQHGRAQREIEGYAGIDPEDDKKGTHPLSLEAEDTLCTDSSGNPTHFSARITAAATALRDERRLGTYWICHTNGKLTILPTAPDEPSKKGEEWRFGGRGLAAFHCEEGHTYSENWAKSVDTLRAGPEGPRGLQRLPGCGMLHLRVRFGERYDQALDDFIHVHHEIPLSVVGPGYEVGFDRGPQAPLTQLPHDRS